MIELTSAMTALVTPIKNGKIDYNCYAKLIERQINNGIDAVIPAGTTGESATLTLKEHKDCIKTAIDVCKGTKTKIIAGIGSNATAKAVCLAQFAQEAGVDAVLAVTPYYNKPSQEGLYEHYKAIAVSIDIPIVLYNVPSRTAVDLKDNTVIRLFNDFKNITSIKDATGDISRCINLLAKCPKITLLSGNDAINYPLMVSGAKGSISVIANLLPNMLTNLIHRLLENDFLASKDIDNKLFAITSAIFCQTNPILIKASMYIAGLIPTLEYRLPLVNPSQESIKVLKKVMSNYKIVE